MSRPPSPINIPPTSPNQPLPPLPPLPTPIVNLPTSRIKLVAEPTTFDGSKAKYRQWLRSCINYFTTYPNDFNTDATRVRYTLSLMTEGLAKEWADNAWDEIEDPITGEFNWAITTWPVFKQHLDQAFLDVNKKTRAHHQLIALRQGTDSAESYFLRFDTHARACGYITAARHFDDFLIETLQVGVNTGLIKRVYDGAELPTTYAGWKAKIIRLEDLQNRFRASQTERRGPPQPFRPTTSGSIVLKPEETKRDGSGVTHGGTGAPMDLDEMRKKGLCFKCKKHGHLSRNCPERQERPRFTREMELSKEDKEWMAAELRKQGF